MQAHNFPIFWNAQPCKCTLTHGHAGEHSCIQKTPRHKHSSITRSSSHQHPLTAQGHPKYLCLHSHSSPPTHGFMSGHSPVDLYIQTHSGTWNAHTKTHPCTLTYILTKVLVWGIPFQERKINVKRENQRQTRIWGAAQTKASTHLHTHSGGCQGSPHSYSSVPAGFASPECKCLVTLTGSRLICLWLQSNWESHHPF